jgi:hypothetical protein
MGREGAKEGCRDSAEVVYSGQWEKRVYGGVYYFTITFIRNYILGGQRK